MTRDQAPQFHLPQRPTLTSGGSASGKLACVLLVVVIGLQVLGWVRSGQPEPEVSAGTVEGTPVTDLKAVAMKLEDRNLPAAAADAWRQYLAGTALEPLDRAKILYRIGKLRFQSEQYQQAVADLYTAEQLAGDRDADLARQIAMQVRECLQKLGRYSELTREMAARATPGTDAETALAGRPVVAQIGEEKITVADFERLLQAEIDMAVQAQLGMSPGQADEFRKQAAKQFAEPQAKAQALHQMVASRVLASEARQAKLEESPEYRRRLIALADGLLASTLMADEVGKRAVVTPEDTERYYQANKDRYSEPAKVTLAHIVVGSEEKARELLGRIQAGENFADLAQLHSTDERTKANGGRLPQPVGRDAASIPGIGRNPELLSAVWAVPSDTVLNEVYKTDAGWHIVKVLERTEAAERSYAEVKDQVEQDTRAARQREVSQQYLQELFERHEVKTYPEAFLTASKGNGAATEPRP
ncbi:MAG: peptidyl-prolyl cis-trans isomerase [Planctomycetota bacterium]